MDRQDDWGDEGELRARLDAYAASRLEPDPAATARSRAAVMAQAHAGRGATRTVEDVAGPGLFGRLFRRFALAATAALLGVALVAAGTVAASPGGPLYAARLWVETLTLPSDTTARAAAELDRLQARLDDATAAAANGNGDAVTAALDAYRQTLADAFAVAGDDLTRQQHLFAELGRHEAVLEALVGQVPPTAEAAIQQAVQRTQAAIDVIIQAPSQPNGTPNPSQPNGTPNPSQPNGTPNPSQPNGTPNPSQPNGTPNPGQPGKTPNPGLAGPSPSPGNPGHTPNPGGPDKTPPAH